MSIPKRVDWIIKYNDQQANMVFCDIPKYMTDLLSQSDQSMCSQETECVQRHQHKALGWVSRQEATTQFTDLPTQEHQ